MHVRRQRWGSALVAAVAVGSMAAAGSAQQAAGGRGQAPPAPRTAQTIPPPVIWPAPPLADGPLLIESAEERNLRIVVTKGLSHPWSMAFLPDGAILITERAGRLRIVRNGVLDPAPVAGVPMVAAQGLAGLLDIALHPRFAENKFIYLTYHKPIPLPAGETAPPGRGGGPPATTTRRPVLGRATWDGKQLTDLKELFVNDVITEASRIVFDRDGMLYMSMGNSTEGQNAPSQNPANYGGKLIRLKDDGTVPPDNPFLRTAGYKPEIYTLGHRNQLGLAVHPVTGEIWAAEQGPNGGDEINIIKPGRNYGWPVVSYGRSYGGPRVSEVPWQAIFEQPVAVWVPSIAVSGLTFYTGDKFPRWKNNLFVGGLRQGEVPRTGQLQRIVFNDKFEEIRREALLREFGQRIRDVRQGPDGYLYVLTEENDAALLRFEPAPAPAAVSSSAK
jgi:glucose/arabinose dehydrogenase